MLIQIQAVDLPGIQCAPSAESPGGYHNIHVGVQRRDRPDELLGLTPADASSASWTLDCVPTATATGFDLTGPYLQGRPGARFVYLSWGTVDSTGDFELFRRAKLWLDCIPTDIVTAAVEHGMLIGRLGLTDNKGNPLCAAVRPPLIAWSASTQN